MRVGSNRAKLFRHCTSLEASVLCAAQMMRDAAPDIASHLPYPAATHLKPVSPLWLGAEARQLCSRG